VSHYIRITGNYRKRELIDLGNQWQAINDLANVPPMDEY
jgi:hypothetical protein